MGVICIVNGDYKPTYNWGGTTLCLILVKHCFIYCKQPPSVRRQPLQRWHFFTTIVACWKSWPPTTQKILPSPDWLYVVIRWYVPCQKSDNCDSLYKYNEGPPIHYVVAWVMFPCQLDVTRILALTQRVSWRQFWLQFCHALLRVESLLEPCETLKHPDETMTTGSTLVRYLTGWWFGTFFIFPYVGNVIIPIDFHILQRGGPTHQPVYCLNRLWSMAECTNQIIASKKSDFLARIQDLSW